LKGDQIGAGEPDTSSVFEQSGMILQLNITKVQLLAATGMLHPAPWWSTTGPSRADTASLVRYLAARMNHSRVRHRRAGETWRPRHAIGERIGYSERQSAEQQDHESLFHMRTFSFPTRVLRIRKRLAARLPGAEPQ
jgi:hypothetical protein